VGGSGEPVATTRTCPGCPSGETPLGAPGRLSTGPMQFFGKVWDKQAACRSKMKVLNCRLLSSPYLSDEDLADLAMGSVPRNPRQARQGRPPFACPHLGSPTFIRKVKNFVHRSASGLAQLGLGLPRVRKRSVMAAPDSPAGDPTPSGPPSCYGIPRHPQTSALQNF